MPSIPADYLGTWFESFLENLTLESERNFLPLPHRSEDLSQEPQGLALKLRALTCPGTDRLELIVALVATRRPEDLKILLPPPIELTVTQTQEGARLLAQYCLSLIFLAVDDWSRCIDQLFTAAASRNATDAARARLVETAGYVSASNQGQRSFDIARRLLNLRHLDGPAVSAGFMALVTAQLRFERAGARHALSQAEQLAFELLTSALEKDRALHEALYNLARQLMEHSPKMALAFYSQLLRTESSYDERWYFHRDLGLIYYGTERFQDAAHHYDLACHLKDDDSELFRFAGDAYYYRGHWAEALLRFDRAISIEPIEKYFLDEKIAFARRRIRRGVDRNRGFGLTRGLSLGLSSIGGKLASTECQWIARPLFSLAKGICDLNFYADKWLALYANRRGSYQQAVAHLKSALGAVADDPSVRLNLVLNMIFASKGKFEAESRRHAKIAIFHGGLETRNRFRLSLTNTQNQHALREEFEELFHEVVREREQWQQRRRQVLKPKAFGGVVHFEFRE
jgi:tetratricopeptide (TPR) repeat protein